MFGESREHSGIVSGDGRAAVLQLATTGQLELVSAASPSAVGRAASMSEAKQKKGGIKVGQHVWVKDAAIAGSDLFTKGCVLAVDEKGKVTVETSNGTKTQELMLPQEECHQPHPGDDVPDHCQLMYLSQPTPERGVIAQ